MNRLVNLFLLLILALNMLAQTSTSSDGNWNTGGNWTNGVPADDETATIQNDMTLNVDLNIDDGNYTVSTGTITDNNGGSAYNIDIRGTGYFEVSGKVVIEGDLEVRNFGEFILKGCDTMIIKGDVDFRNDAVVTIEECAVLIIEGDLGMRNDNVTTVNGTVSVGGDLVSRNFSEMIGTGNLETNGEIDINNSSEIFGSTTNCSPGPCEYGSGIGLPIELTSFNAAYINPNQIQFEWTTATEINNNYFTLEYSTDGKMFQKLKRVNGAGNSSIKINYESIINITLDQSAYVRLRQTDFDGTTKTFKPVYLSEFIPNKEGLSELKVYPNPGEGNYLKLSSNEILSKTYLITIRSLSGMVVFQQEYILENEGYLEQEISRISLEKGIYVISLQSDSKNLITKYIVN